MEEHEAKNKNGNLLGSANQIANLNYGLSEPWFLQTNEDLFIEFFGLSDFKIHYKQAK